MEISLPTQHPVDLRYSFPLFSHDSLKVFGSIAFSF
jgi:hypothetical protein